MAASGGGRLRALAGVLATLALLTPSLGSTLTAQAASPPFVPVDDPAPDAPTITLTSVTPVVDASDATPDEPAEATIRGRITNGGQSAIERPTVSVVRGDATMNRAGIARWSESTAPAIGTLLDDAELPSVAPGRSASFALTVAAADLAPGRSWGVSPVSVQSGPTAVRTFIGVHRAKEYEPLRLLWGVPVTLPATEEMWGAPGADRSAAWEREVGEESDLAETTSRRPRAGEMWLVDPLLLPEHAPEADRGLPAAEQEARSTRAEALAEVLDPDRTVILPAADADVVAATSPPTRSLLRPQVRTAAAAAERLDARGDVVWPSDGLLSVDRADLLRELYGGAATVVVPRTVLGTTVTPHAFHASRDGTPLIVTDPELSDLAATVGRELSPTLATQRLVAESSAILADLPGTVRTIAVVPPRDGRPDPQAYADLRAAIGEIPWTEPGELRDGDEAASATIDLPATLENAPAPVLTPARARDIQADIRDRRSVATVRSDGRTWSRTLSEAQVQLTSARWRTRPEAMIALQAQQHEDISRITRDLRIPSGEVNFFAETGRLQVTVENHTDITLQGLHVHLRPDTHILRIEDDPEPVTVAPRSRRTVTVQATALAPGRVPISVEVTDPSGRQLAPQSELRVRVSPTGIWIYWAIGAAAILLVLVGRWRSVRRRP